MQHKLVRLNALLAKEISVVINNKINDPRLSNTIISVHKVETTPHLSQSFVYVSIISDSQDHGLILEILNDAAGFIRTILSKSKVISSCPTILFREEKDMETNTRLSNIFDSIKKSQTNSSNSK